MATTATHRGIVVGVDGSPASLVAVAWAARAAALHQVPLTLIHVLASPVLMAWPEMPLPPEFLQWPEADGRNLIREAMLIAEAATRTAPIEIASEMVSGQPVASLVDASKDAQLVAVGAHGRGRLRRMLGSISSGLVQHALCPVAVVHDDNLTSSDLAGALARPDLAGCPVVVGIDGSRASESATAIAFEEAARRGVSLVAVHACADWGGGDYPGLEWSALEQQGQEVLQERLAGWNERYPDVRVDRVVVPSHAAEHLVEWSKNAQLVVVGSHGRGGFAGMLLGSVSSAVVQSARVPVIVARTW